MINKLLIFLVALSTFTLYAQDNFDPKILVLSPNKLIFEKSMEMELLKNVSEYKAGLDLNAATNFLQSEEFKEYPASSQETAKSEIAYLKILDYTNITSYLTEQYLYYTIREKLENVVVKLSTEKSNGGKNELAKFANGTDIDFVINLSLLEFYKSEKVGFLKISVQLYQKETSQIILDKSYTGDWSNPGFQYTCEEKSVNCCINNALSKAVAELSSLIVENDPAIKKEKQVAAERKTILLNNYYKQTFEKSALEKIIPAKKGNIDPEKAYQLLFSEDKTKFVAFFAESVPATEGKAFHDSKNDRNVSIESDDQMAMFKGKFPNTYNYIVKGVLYKNKWYYEKVAVTYFDSESIEKGKQQFFCYLAKWNFFIENTAKVNPGFWEATGKSGHTLAPSSLFEKVLDLKKDPNWEKYKDMWEKEEKENQPFVGMYEIVADQLKEEEKK
jgi:hypothetical protein